MPTTAARPVVLLEQDFGDAEFRVTKHPDGMITIDMSEPRLVLNADQFELILQAFVQLHRSKCADLRVLCPFCLDVRLVSRHEEFVYCGKCGEYFAPADAATAPEASCQPTT